MHGAPVHLGDPALIGIEDLARPYLGIGITDVAHGLRLGAGVGIGFSGTAITIAYLWESKPFKVWMIDVSYYVLGCVLLGVILSAWH